MSGMPPLTDEQWAAISSTAVLHGHPRFYQLLDEIAQLHSRKNHDYAQDDDPLSNLRRSEKFGIPGSKSVLIRMADKWSRLEELSHKQAQVTEESLIDTLKDLAIYALLDIVLLEEEAKKVLDKPPVDSVT